LNMKKGECSECGRPLFDQEKSDPETQLCDKCWEEGDLEK